MYWSTWSTWSIDTCALSSHQVVTPVEIDPSAGHTPVAQFEARFVMFALLSFAPGAVITSASLERCNAMLDLAYVSSSYDDRLIIGRKAQLGEEMIYRSGLNIDSTLTYGEFDLNLFASLVDRALDGVADGATFVDVGSGAGRLVLAASSLWPQFGLCAGVECVPELHRVALDAAARVELPPSSPKCEFVLGKAEDALGADGRLSSVDVAFAYSSTWPGEGQYLSDFSLVCGTHLKVGARVITADRMLMSLEGAWEFRLLDSIEGHNRETGGQSIGYIHQVVQSQRST